MILIFLESIEKMTVKKRYAFSLHAENENGIVQNNKKKI